MIRKLAMAMCLVLLVSLCAACGGESGWIYDLPKGYTLHCVDGSVCVEQNGEQALDYGVTAFCTGARYVGIRQEHGTANGTETVYFLLDTENSVFYSAQDEAEFEDVLESLNVTDLGAWIETSKKPSGAHN